MMIIRHVLLLATLTAPFALSPAFGQTPPPPDPTQQQKPGQAPSSTGDAGPATDAGPLIIKKKTADSADTPCSTTSCGA